MTGQRLATSSADTAALASTVTPRLAGTRDLRSFGAHEH